MDETKYWVWLTMVFGIGSMRIWEAMCLFESAIDAYNGLKSEFMLKRLKPKEKDKILSTSIEQAVSLIEQHTKNGVKTVGYSSDEYPVQMRHIMNPPAVLYCKGNVSCMRSRKIITAVGTRNASEYSLRVTEDVCTRLALAGFVIVSGFAVGIDITAHLSASRNKSPTICVMGGGVDIDYPRENFVYRDKILNNNGLFISEYPMGTRPLPQNFPKRNRILSAISYATIVFEASDMSGSLITAGLSAEYGREVFCIPPSNILSKKYSGNSMLIRDGAEMLFDCDDIFAYFSSLEEYTEEEFFSESNYHGNTASENAVSESSTEEISTKIISSDSFEQLTEVQKKIYSIIGSEPVHADVIAVRLGLDAEELFFELTELEMTGLIRSLPGKMYEKI